MCVSSEIACKVLVRYTYAYHKYNMENVMISWTNDFHCETMVVHNIRTTTSFAFQVVT